MYGKQPKQGMTLKSSTVSPKGRTESAPKLKQYRESANAGSGRTASGAPLNKAKAGRGDC